MSISAPLLTLGLALGLTLGLALGAPEEAPLPVLKPGASLAGFRLADLTTGEPREVAAGGPTLLVIAAPSDATALAKARKLAVELASTGPDPVRLRVVVRELHADRGRLLLEWLVGLPEVAAEALLDPYSTLAPGSPSVTALIDTRGLIVAVDVPLDAAAPLAALLRAQPPQPDNAPVSDLDEAERAELLRGDSDAEVRLLERRASAADATAFDLVRAGTARWLRHQKQTGPGDAAAALAHFQRAALRAPDADTAEPARRFGPRLGKRTASTAWVARAQFELAERGVELAPLVPQPTAGEQLGASTELPRLAEQQTAPDPSREVAQDTDNLLRVETADMPNIDLFVPGVDTTVATTRVHLSVVPSEGVLFDPDAAPPTLWIVVPQGVGIDRNLHTPAARDPLDLARTAYDVDFEVLAAPGTQTAVLRGYVLANVLDRQGRRTEVRRDLRIPCTVRPGA